MPAAPALKQAGLESKLRKRYRRLPERLKLAVEILGVAALYCAAAKLSLGLAFAETNASPMWPPAGIGLAAVLLLGYRAGWGILLGAAVANIAEFYSNQAAGPGTILLVSTVIGAGNAAEACLGAFLFRRWIGPGNSFCKAGDVFKFGAAASAMCLISAAVGPSVLRLSGIVPGAIYGLVWFTWWLGDTVGVLLLAPPLLAWSRGPRSPWRPGKTAESLLLFALLALASGLTFSGRPLPAQAHSPLLFLPLPLLLWIIFRFGPRAATSSVLVVSAAAMWHTLRHAGPFAQANLQESLLLLSGFMAVVSFSVLVVTAILSERNALEAALNRDREDLEVRVKRQTAALTRANKVLLEEIMERKLKEGHLELQRNIITHIPIGLLVLGMDDPDDPRTLRVVDINPSGGRMLGASRPELIGRRLYDFAPQVFESGLPETFAGVIGDGVGREIGEYASRLNPGTFYAIKTFPLPHRKVGASFEDITARKRAQEALREKGAALARSNAELAGFAYIASHDLQEPLRKVSAFADRLRERISAALDDEGRDYFRRIDKALVGMGELIDSLLTLARVTTQAQPLKEVDLRALAREVISDLDLTIARSGGRVELRCLPRVRADPFQMRQLLQNLIANALKFRKKDVPPLVRIHGSLLHNGLCEIRVKDNGIGFDEKYLDRIFQPFQRLHSRAEYEGTGMGLAICRRIAARHGGAISAKSLPGKGSSFKVVLPAAPPALPGTRSSAKSAAAAQNFGPPPAEAEAGLLQALESRGRLSPEGVAHGTTNQSLVD
ncbi:MAG: hypothetical protein A3G41_07245 [Elusimicrobia bacterium RIFCSPLOWO2_12_FULL_59_9]|nr:MAG: hypothetical protein A3G41_07245 [Elusimicrobia bacterium RIFCSPLOWO2_12_FULL_59_9]